MGLFADIETAVVAKMIAVVDPFGATLLGVFRPAFILGFSIWISLIAYEVAYGKSDDGFTYIFTKIGKIFLIGTFALLGWPELAELLNGIKDGFVGAQPISTTLENSLVNPYYDLYITLFEWGNTALTNSTSGFAILNVVKVLFISSFLMITVLVFLCFGLILGFICIVSLALFLISNSIFVMLLAIGPVFLLCLCFPFTQRYFETYIGNVITSILAMAFTILMIRFVATLVGFEVASVLLPPAADSEGVIATIKEFLIYCSSQALLLLLIIYMYFKIFDLAAALGGGLNMGNNMIGGVRSILRDLQKNGSAGGSSSNKTNQITQGGGSGGPAKAVAGNQSLTGMTVSAAAPAIGAIGGAIATGVRNLGSIASYGAGRTAGAAGRFAYNRYSQNQNRIAK